MGDPSYIVALRLTLAVAPGRDGQAEPAVTWDDLASIADREHDSRRFPSESRPARADAEAVLAETFAKHPMVSVGERAAGGAVERPPRPRSGEAVVLAEVVELDHGATGPGEAFTDVTREVIAGPLLVHARRWPDPELPRDAASAAHIVLEEVSRALPPDLWGAGGDAARG